MHNISKLIFKMPSIKCHDRSYKHVTLNFELEGNNGSSSVCVWYWSTLQYYLFTIYDLCCTSNTNTITYTVSSPPQSIFSMMKETVSVQVAMQWGYDVRERCKFLDVLQCPAVITQLVPAPTHDYYYATIIHICLVCFCMLLEMWNATSSMDDDVETLGLTSDCITGG